MIVLLKFISKALRKVSTLGFNSVKRIKLFSYRNLTNIDCSLHSTTRIGRRFSINSDLSKTEIVILPHSEFRDNCHIRLGHGGKLSIGQACFFNNGCSITCLGSIAIGNDCQFGENVLLYDHNHRYSDRHSLISSQGYSIGEIKIGANCWIGSNVVILKDVTIGDNVVIGAGCIIYKSIEEGSVVVNKQELIIKKLNS